MTDIDNENVMDDSVSAGQVRADNGLDSSTPEVTNRLPVGRQLIILASILGGMFLFGGASFFLGGSDKQNNTQIASVPSSSELDAAKRSKETLTFSKVELLAQSAIVVDLKTGKVLYKKDPELKWPLASITKLMTALVAKETIEEGSTILITKEALEQAGDSGLRLGEKFSYRNLSDLILLTSSNDGAYALAAAAGASLDTSAPEESFVKAMNVRAKELGLQGTYFRNPTGLDISETEAGAYSTSRDIAVLMEYILNNYPEILEETTKTRSVIYNKNGQPHDSENTNRVVGTIATVIGSKTGYTTLAGGNLTVAFDVGFNHPVVAVVLGSSHQGRFSDMLQLVEATKNQIISEK